MSLITFVYLCGSLIQVNVHYPAIHQIHQFSPVSWARLTSFPEYKEEFNRVKPDIQKIKLDSRDGIPCL